MSASASGSIEEPGRNVRAKTGLNKSILDQGWFEFRRQLDCKLNWMGGELVEVDYRYTSQRCSQCGHTSKDNRRSQDVFVCLDCGYKQHADTNAVLLPHLSIPVRDLPCMSERSRWSVISLEVPSEIS